MRARRGTATLVAMGIVALLGCGTYDAPVAPPPPPPPPPPAGTGIKDIIISRLPSPYYHFAYDANGRVSFVSFASDFTRYDVSYSGGRISEMDNNILVNHDRLVYVYDDLGRVALVEERDSSDVFMLVVFTYDGTQLTGVERDRRVAGGFIIDKQVALSYYPDGNLRQLTVHRPAITAVQDEQTYADLYEQYDTGVNVDGFDLLHDDFFDHLILLPAVALQNTNPGRVTRTGDGETYVVDYTYTYDAHQRPLSRTGQLTITNGTNAGQQIELGAVYSYY